METQEKGISTRRFFTLLIATLVGMFILGILVNTNQASNVGSLVGRFASEFLGKFVLFALLAVFLNGVFFYAVLDVKLADLPWLFGAKGNSSFATLFCFLSAVALTIIIGMRGATVQDMLFVLFVKGAIGLAVGTLVTVIVAFLSGVRSLDSFAVWVNLPGTDAHARIVGATLLGTVILAMSI